MEQGPNRRTFLRGAAGAMGMGAVGVLAAKARFADASEPLDSQAQVIPVYFVGGGRKEGTLLVPDAAAAPGDTVTWEPREGVRRIVHIKFKEAGRNPFDNTRDIFRNPSSGAAFSKGVPDDATVDATHNYRIKVTLEAGGTATSKDPPLDIVPGG